MSIQVLALMVLFVLSGLGSAEIPLSSLLGRCIRREPLGKTRVKVLVARVRAGALINPSGT